MKQTAEEKRESSFLAQIHRIECFWCGAWYNEHLPKCKNCGTENSDFEPKTIFKVKVK